MKESNFVTTHPWIIHFLALTAKLQDRSYWFPVKIYSIKILPILLFSSLIEHFQFCLVFIFQVDSGIKYGINMHSYPEKTIFTIFLKKWYQPFEVVIKKSSQARFIQYRAFKSFA